MLVIMKQTRHTAYQVLEKGKPYNLTDALASRLIEDRLAIPVTPNPDELLAGINALKESKQPFIAPVIAFLEALRGEVVSEATKTPYQLYLEELNRN